MYPHIWLRHRRSRSAPSDQISTIEACGRRSRTQNDLHHHARQGLALSRTLLRPLRSMTSPSPSVAVMIRPAADEITTRDGHPLVQAGISYVANGPASYMRGEELAVAVACKAFRTRRRDGLTTTAAVAVAAGGCCLE